MTNDSTTSRRLFRKRAQVPVGREEWVALRKLAAKNGTSIAREARKLFEQGGLTNVVREHGRTA